MPTRRQFLAAGAGLALLAACSPKLDWREVRPAGTDFVIALPGRPQIETREFELAGRKLSMTMASAGVGATLFAAGVATLPADALAAEPLAAVVDGFRAALLRNVGATESRVRSAPPLRSAGMLRSAQAVTATGKTGREARAVQLAARFYVVDDRLYQLVALGAAGELPPAALDSFFDSFRLAR
jgi:hypothetical protein